MPTYNRANFIKETIESIRDQTYQNWELIIVDDGSDDNSEEIVQGIKDDRIQFYKAGRIAINGRIKNIGIEKAQGQLISFMDSDDLWAETKLEKQLQALKDYPDAGFSLTGGYNFRNIYQPIDFFYKQRDGILYGEIFIPFFKSEISTTTPSLIVRRESLRIVGGFDESKPFSDTDFILKLASHFKAVILYEPLLYRRLHDSNDSGTNWMEGYMQGVELISVHKKELPAAIRREAFFRLYVNFGEDCFAHGKKPEAIKNFFRAWRNKPLSIVPIKKSVKGLLKWILNIDPSRIPQTTRSIPKPWNQRDPPKRILAIRLQAMGDVVITLPYLQYLRKTLPSSTKIDFLTRKECEDIPKNISLFTKVISLGGGRNFKKQILLAIILLPKLFFRRYDVVIDLQNNEVSQFIRKAVRPKAWSVFDRFSPVAAGERTRMAIEAVNLGKNGIDSHFHFTSHFDPNEILKKNGWDGISDLVILNPAAAFPTRNWPLENYVSFVGLWLNQFPNTRFLVLGTSFIKSKADFLKNKLGERLINIIDQTTPFEAFAIIQKVKFILSEDSGLMHMAWVSGVPTLAIFGSTRSDWSKPLGKHSSFLDSSDLPCGNCMQETCFFGDNHCLTRYTPAFIFEKAINLVE